MLGPAEAPRHLYFGKVSRDWCIRSTILVATDTTSSHVHDACLSAEATTLKRTGPTVPITLLLNTFSDSASDFLFVSASG